MFITEKKRAVYDEKGALYKMDVLRSIRRKDAPESMMRAIKEDEGEKETQTERLNTIKKIVEVVLIVIIFGACCLLAYSLASSAGLFPKASTVDGEVKAFDQEQPLLGIGEWAGFSQKNRAQAFVAAFLQNSKCGVVKDNILRCEISVESLRQEKDK